MGESLGLIDTGLSGGTQITGGASHVKGSWDNIGTATIDFEAIEFYIVANQFNHGQLLIDFDVDGVIYAENIFHRARSVGNQNSRCIRVYRGGSIGDVIRARAQHKNSTPRWFEVYARLISGSELPCTSSTVSDSYGGVNASTEGTIIDPGAVANTQVITELIPSLSNTINFININMETIDTSLASDGWIAELFTGPSGSEVSTGIRWNIYGTTSFDCVSLPVFRTFVDEAVFTAGTRVAIGLQSETVDAGNRVIHMTAHTSRAIKNTGGGSPSGRRLIDGSLAG